jgi:hypothetical protein
MKPLAFEGAYPDIVSVDLSLKSDFIVLNTGIVSQQH